MTSAIYVTSTQTFSGKSALCVGLLRRFQRDGRKVGYMKPVSTMIRMVAGRSIDEDAHFVKYTLGLAESPEEMAPVLLDDLRVMAIMADNGHEDLAERLRTAYRSLSADKELVILEGGANLREGWIINLTPAHVADMLEAQELIVVPYQDELQVVDDLLTARLRLGDSLIGGVINRIPADRLDFVQTELKGYVEKRGIPILAWLPEERALLSASIGEVADGLGAEVLCSHHALDTLVEHLMVGAMDVEQALIHFRQISNKAVITSGDRTDVLLSALETSTCCLILTGNLPPSPLILERAEAINVPVILTVHDTLTAIEVVESFFGKSRFHQQEKVERFDRLLDKYMDFEALYQAINPR